MVQELVGKYIFLVQTFVEAGEQGLSWQQVARRWENRYGEPYPRRSFVNHRAAVEEVFGISIRCDRHTNHYKIDKGESAVDQREAVDYLINTFTPYIKQRTPERPGGGGGCPFRPSVSHYAYAGHAGGRYPAHPLPQVYE